MYRVRIRLYAELNDPLPAAARQTWLERDFAPGERVVGDLLRALQVPTEEVDLVLLDAISAALTNPVPDGARLSAFPVFERFDISPLARLRDPPCAEPASPQSRSSCDWRRHCASLGSSCAPRRRGPLPSAARSSSRAMQLVSARSRLREPSWSAIRPRARPHAGVELGPKIEPALADSVS